MAEAVPRAMKEGNSVRSAFRREAPPAPPTRSAKPLPTEKDKAGVHLDKQQRIADRRGWAAVGGSTLGGVRGGECFPRTRRAS